MLELSEWDLNITMINMLKIQWTTYMNRKIFLTEIKNFKIESNANTKIKTTSSQMNFLIDLSADWKRLRKKLMNLKIGQ